MKDEPTLKRNITKRRCALCATDSTAAYWTPSYNDAQHVAQTRGPVYQKEAKANLVITGSLVSPSKDALCVEWDGCQARVTVGTLLAKTMTGVFS